MMTSRLLTQRPCARRAWPLGARVCSPRVGSEGTDGYARRCKKESSVAMNLIFLFCNCDHGNRTFRCVFRAIEDNTSRLARAGPKLKV